MYKINEATVEITKRCLNKCLFCSSISDNTEDLKNEIPLDKLKEISKFCLHRGAKYINISGGEPLLRNDLIDYVDFNRSIGLKSVIYTSGNCDKTFSLSNLALSCRDDKENIKFVFNYQSLDNKINQKLTNCKELNNIVENHMIFLYNLGIDYEINIVPNSINIDTIYDTIIYLRDEFKVNKINLLRLVPQGRAEENESVLMDDNYKQKLDKLFESLKTISSSDEFQIKYSTPFNNYDKLCNKSYCKAGYHKLLFKYDGNIFPCEAYKEAPNKEKYILGNIYKDSLDDIIRAKTVAELPIGKVLTLDPCPAQSLYEIKTLKNFILNP